MQYLSCHTVHVVFVHVVFKLLTVWISYSKQYGYILEQIRTILSMNSVYDMVVSFLRHGEVESQTEMATYVLFTVHTDRHRQTNLFSILTVLLVNLVWESVTANSMVIF